MGRGWPVNNFCYKQQIFLGCAGQRIGVNIRNGGDLNITFGISTISVYFGVWCALFSGDHITPKRIVCEMRSCINIIHFDVKPKLILLQTAAQQLVSVGKFRSWVSFDVHDRGYLCDKNSVSNLKTICVTCTLVLGSQISRTHSILLTVTVMGL